MTLPITIAIPTYRRGAVLLDTLHALIAQDEAESIVVLDQTEEHSQEVREALDALDARGAIRWIRSDRPSIPASMNRALLEAKSEFVLFVDDDIRPGPGLAAQHLRAYRGPSTWAVVGQVLQPGEHPCDPPATADNGLRFCFRQNRGAFVENVMAGNLSVRRERALEIGGFDENFIGVAYRFETDFARRIVVAGGRIWYEPAATIDHLRAPAGGTRRYGNHLASASPMHGVGAYYFALVTPDLPKRGRHILLRPLREIRTRFHLTHPWWIPVKFIGELRALILALRLKREGRRLVER